MQDREFWRKSMINNLKISAIILIMLIGIYLINNRSQSKFESTSTAIFTDDSKDIFKGI